MILVGANISQSDMRKQAARKCGNSRKQGSSGRPLCRDRSQHASLLLNRHPTRVLNGALERLEPCAGKLARTVLRGGCGGNAAPLLDREILLENRNAAGVGQAIFTNSYDSLSNRLSVIELDNARVSYSYDSTSQLVSEARSGSFAYNRSYVWDGLGNRLQQYDSGVLTQRTFNAANEMLTIVPASGAPTTQVFDANGNLTLSTTGSAVTTNTWSPNNQLLSQVSPTVNEQYQYSQDGMRQQKVNSTGTTQFTLDGPNVLLETTPASALQARNTQYPNGYGGVSACQIA